jgi:hypothetical protein
VTLPALATQADVESMLGRPLSTLEATYIANQLLKASGLVRLETRQQISQTLADTFTTNGNWGQKILLPQFPVTNVVSVTVTGTLWDSSRYQWDRYGYLTLSTGSFQPDYGASLYGGTDHLLGPAGSNSGPLPSGNSWMGPAAQIVVVYDHGYAAIPDDIANMVAGVVALQISAGVGVTMEQIGNYKVAYQRSDGGGLTLTDQNRKDLKRYRRTATSSSISSVR